MGKRLARRNSSQLTLFKISHHVRRVQAPRRLIGQFFLLENGAPTVEYINKNIDKIFGMPLLTKDKQDLIDFTKNYFPDNFNDFSESNPGMIFLELASYVGDVLSYYTDTQVQETFIIML